MPYIDATVIAVPTEAKAAYVEFARATAKIFKEFGATEVVDAWGNDVPDGKQTDFKRAVAAAQGETVAFGWITWPDKAARDAAWEKVMADPRMKDTKMPFDGQRMIYAGFEQI
ncbi:putative protein YbaA [Alphaproteobacteria bacterium SO-S41]|nr:putative protein YbaA [Alphaproteobacteria bacterium SO-S41]